MNVLQQTKKKLTYRAISLLHFKARYSYRILIFLNKGITVQCRCGLRKIDKNKTEISKKQHITYQIIQNVFTTL